MGGDGNSRGLCGARKRRYHIAGAIQASLPAQRLKLLGHPGGPFFFKEGGGRDSAQLQVLLVDPISLAAEPFETGSSRGGRRKVDYGSDQLWQASVYRRAY
jgi:hypothetical protein